MSKKSDVKLQYRSESVFSTVPPHGPDVHLHIPPGYDRVVGSVEVSGNVSKTTVVCTKRPPDVLTLKVNTDLTGAVDDLKKARDSLGYTAVANANSEAIKYGEAVKYGGGRAQGKVDDSRLRGPDGETVCVGGDPFPRDLPFREFTPHKQPEPFGRIIDDIVASHGGNGWATGLDGDGEPGGCKPRPPCLGGYDAPGNRRYVEEHRSDWRGTGPGRSRTASDAALLADVAQQEKHAARDVTYRLIYNYARQHFLRLQDTGILSRTFPANSLARDFANGYIDKIV